jgi:hypothetical protein
MKEALQTTLILVVWIVFWLGGTFGGAVLQSRLIDIGIVSDVDPPWIITIGSSFIGFFAFGRRRSSIIILGWMIGHLLFLPRPRGADFSTGSERVAAIIPCTVTSSPFCAPDHFLLSVKSPSLTAAYARRHFHPEQSQHSDGEGGDQLPVQ